MVALGGKQRSATSRGVRVASLRASTALERGRRAFLPPAASYARFNRRIVWPNECRGCVRAPRSTAPAHRSAAGISVKAGRPRRSTASCNVARARDSSTYSLKYEPHSENYIIHINDVFALKSVNVQPQQFFTFNMSFINYFFLFVVDSKQCQYKRVQLTDPI